jgi:hypothetical protein
MSPLRTVALGAVLAAGAFAASAAAAKPAVPANPGLQNPALRFCVPIVFTDTFRAGMTRYIVTYRVDRRCRTTIVRIVRVPVYKSAGR